MSKSEIIDTFVEHDTGDRIVAIVERAPWGGGWRGTIERERLELGYNEPVYRCAADTKREAVAALFRRAWREGRVRRLEQEAS